MRKIISYAKIMVVVSLLLYGYLLGQGESTDKAKETSVDPKREALEKQKYLKSLFDKFIVKLENVSIRLKSQSVEYARRVEAVKKFIKDEAMSADFERIIKLLESESFIKSDAIVSLDKLEEKFERILEILENKMRQEELLKKLNEMREKYKRLEELAKEQEKLNKDARSINKDIEEMESLKDALEKFKESQQALKNVTDKNKKSSQNDEKISELLKKLRKIKNEHAKLSDEMMKDMPQESQNLLDMLNKLIDLQDKMKKTQDYLKAMKDFEAEMKPGNKNNIEDELEKLLKRAGNIQKNLNEYKNSGNIPESEDKAKQLKKYAEQVSNFQDKFFKYPFKTKRFNKFMESLLKSQRAFDFASQLAEENLAKETADEWQKAQDYFNIAKKLLKNLPKDIRKKAAKKLSKKVDEQQEDAQKISKFAQDYIQNNKLQKELEKPLDNLKTVPNDLEATKKNIENEEKQDSAQIDHQTALNKVSDAIAQIKKSLNNKQDGAKNEQLAKAMDKLLKESENFQKQLKDTLKNIKKEHPKDDNIKDMADDAKDAYEQAKKDIKKQSNAINAGNKEQAMLPEKDIKKNLKKTEDNLKNIEKTLANANKEKQNELTESQNKLNEEFDKAMQQFADAKNQHVKQTSQQAQRAKPHMQNASKNLKDNQNEQASQNQQKAIEQMEKALRDLQDKMEQEYKKLSEEEKKKLDKIAEEQKKLAQETMKFATKEKMKSKIKKDVEKAAKQMSQASKSFKQGNQQEGRKKQDIVTRLLKKALAKLNNSKLNYETEEAQNQLEAMEVTITEVYEAQKKIYEQTITLNKQLIGGEKNKRAVQYEIRNSLAKEEEKLIPIAEFLVNGFARQGAAVFAKIMAVVVNDMKLTLEQFNKNDVGSYTQSIEEDILKNLESLLDSLKFVIKKLRQRSGGGGSGGPPGGAGRNPPRIPPLAEIKLLKVWQTTIKQKTEKLIDEAQIKFHNANEPKVRLEIWQKEFREKLRKLSYDQDQVADMAEKVKARINQ